MLVKPCTLQAKCHQDTLIGHLDFWQRYLVLKLILFLLEQNSEGTADTLKGYEVKIEQLEKDLFFYKKTSRELKKKLKSLLGESSE